MNLQERADLALQLRRDNKAQFDLRFTDPARADDAKRALAALGRLRNALMLDFDQSDVVWFLETVASSSRRSLDMTSDLSPGEKAALFQLLYPQGPQS